MGAERSVARILRADGRTAGLAFLVAGGRLVTCAHVVNTALGRSRREPDSPEGTVVVRFAFAPDEVRTASVAAWRPDGIWTPKRDLAVLSLTDPVPFGLTGVPLASSTPRSTAQVQFCGPDDEGGLKHVLGTLLGATGEGVRQIDQRRSGAHMAHAGFSGGPVWNENGEVLGVVRAARGEGTDVNCLDVDWVRENLRPDKPEGVVDILQIGPLRLTDSTAEQRIEALCAEIDGDCADRSTTPDLIVFCGDLTANATTKEYRLVRRLIDRLTGRFGLPLDRVLTVPGRTDVNAAMCEAHFVQQEVMEAAPIPPYWAKWMPYSAFLSELDGEPLAKAEPWRLWEIPELKVVLAGLNTTMAYTHRPEDDELLIGDGQLAWFIGRMSSPRYAGWRCIAVAHRVPASEDHEPHLPQLLGHLDLVLAGSGPNETLGDVGVLVPSQGHRLIRLGPSPVDEAVAIPARRPIPTAQAQREPFLDRVVTALELEYPDAQLLPVEHAPVPYIRVIKRYRSGDRLIPSDEMLIGVEPREATVERIERFGQLVDQFRVPGARSVYPFVYFGRLATEEATAFARGHQILLQSFAEFQFKWDPRHFTAWQLRELDADGRYPAEIYIPQRFREFGLGDVARESATVGLTDRVLEWFGEDRSHLIVVLGGAGTGKTFFMRMLARQMSGSRAAPTPVYLQLRDLERIPLLDELVARQFAKAREHRLPVDRFNYYLREGRIALLLDGLDELTVQGSWDKAVQYLTEIREKVTGKAMIVVTARDEEFLSNKQIEQVLRAGTGSIGRRAFKLEHFTLEQVDRFLEQHLGSAEAARERMELLKTFGPIPDVARNPRMLSFLAEIDTDRLVRAREAGAVLGAAELYRQVIEQWKDREEERLRRDDHLPALDREQLWSAVSRLAVNLWRTGRERVTVEELGSAAEVLSHVDTGAQVHQISSGSLLIRFEDGRLGFIHRSLQEWFLAEAIVNDPDIADALAAQRLSDQTARFIAEMLPEVELRAPAAWSPVDPRLNVFQGNAGLLSKHLPERVSMPDAPVLDYSGADLRGFSAAGQSVRGTSFRNSRSAGADFSGKDLTGTDWTGADLRGANFNGAILRNAVLAADLTGAKLLGADLIGADLTGARLDRAALTGALVTDAQLARAATAVGAASRSWPPSAETRPFTAGSVAALNPQETVLATGNERGWIHLWSLPDLRPIRGWRALPGEVRALAWSGDGTRILAGGAGPLSCWGEQGLLVWTMDDNIDDVRKLSWNTVDGRIACYTGNPHRLDIIDQDLEISHDPYRLGPIPLADIAWSPDGTTLAVAPDRGDMVMLAVGQELTWPSFGQITTGFQAAAWSPDSTTLAVIFGEDVKLLDLASMTVAESRLPTGNMPISLSWSHDGRTVLTGNVHGNVEDSDGGFAQPVKEADFLPLYVANTRNDQLIAHGERQTHVWDRHGHRKAQSRFDRNDSIRSAAWSPDGSHIATTDRHGRMRIWSAQLGTTRETQRYGKLRMLMDWAPDGDHIITVDLGGNIRLITLGGKEPHTRVTVEPTALFAARWSPDGRYVAIGQGDGEVHLYSGGGLRRIRSWQLGSQVNDILWPTPDVLYAIDDRNVTGLTVDGSYIIWKTGLSVTPTILRWRDYDRQIVAATMTGVIHHLDTANGSVVNSWTAHTGPIRSLAHSPRKAFLVSGGDDGSIRLWHDTHLQREWTAHEGRVTALDYSPDGRHLLSAGDDGVLRIWHGTTGEPVATLIPLAGGGSAAFNERGFKIDGDLNGEFWYASGQVALDPLELSRYTGLRRLEPDEPLWD